MGNVEKIVLLSNEVEAQLMDSILTERGIPHMIASYYDTAYDGLFQASRGWGHVEAPAEHRDEIVTIHNDLIPDPGDEPNDPGDEPDEPS